MSNSVENGTPTQVVNTMLGLKDIWLATIQDGVFAFVEAGVPVLNRAIYVLVKESGLPENLVTGAIVAPNPGSPAAGVSDGRWILLGPV